MVPDRAHLSCLRARSLTAFDPCPFSLSSHADLIVHTDLSEHSTESDLTTLFDSLLARLHVLVIGPGLGRSSSMQLAARVAIRQARAKGTHLVIDADGLYLVQSDPETVRGYDKCVLTPNVVEFGRLCKAVQLDPGADKKPATLAKRLSKALGGPTVLQKGGEDIISNGQTSLANGVQGGLRRCGGQGDLLSGTTGVFLAWGQRWLEKESGEDNKLEDGLTVPILAAYAASTVTRETSRRTFERLRRAMQASDMLQEVGPAFEAVFPDEGQPKL